jgi:dTDP-4-dehydrorhamnose reductase
MRVLITGATGQVGRALAAAPPADSDICLTGRDGLDLTNPAGIDRIVRELRPDLVINTAAYTAVDRAESEPALAEAVNQAGARHLAEAAAVVGARMIQLSTDYVFDGRGRRPYRPADETGPLGVYGRTKLGGERAVLETLGPRSLVVRTSWVYTAQGRNFLTTMLRLLDERDRITVVADQTGAPTSAASVARAVWAAAGRADIGGILHWTDHGATTWFDFAVAIRDEALAAGRLARAAEVVPIPAEDYPTPAARPRYSVLDCTAAREQLGLVPEPWRAALQRTIREDPRA